MPADGTIAANKWTSARPVWGSSGETGYRICLYMWRGKSRVTEEQIPLEARKSNVNSVPNKLTAAA